MEPIRKIRVKHHNLFLINEKLHIIVEKMIKANQPINNFKDGVANFILAKSYKTHRVILSLAESGFSEDANMLTRTLFDAYLIIASSLKDKTDDTVLKFFRFDDVLRMKMFKSIKDTPTFQEYLQKRKENPKPYDEPIEEIEARANKWIDKYGGDFRQRWHSGQTTSKLAESLNIKKYCETAYSLQCQLLHSLSRVSDLYIVNSGNKLVIDVEPKENGVDVSLVSAFDIFIHIAIEYDKHYNLGHSNELEKLVNELGKSV